MSEFESQASKVRRLLPLLDPRDLVVVLDDVAALMRASFPDAAVQLRLVAVLFRATALSTCNPEVAPAEHSPSCSDVDECGS